MGETTRIGRHEVRYEADTGFIHIANDGTTDEVEAAAILDTLGRYADVNSKDDALFIIADVRKSSPVTPKARNVYVRRMPACETYVVLFGAPIVIRVVFKLLVKALSVTSPRKFVSDAVADEAEARRWLTEQRRAYLARKGRSSGEQRHKMTG
ncbi:MAG TPA: hypothetical protein VM580_18420 [Labilithrix sp.]|nr:hypothetical protein [Labilithrix sp.]